MNRLLAVILAVATMMLWAVPLAVAAGASDTDRQAAEQLLDRLIADQRAQQARDRAEADRLVSAAMDFYKQGDYASARETVDRALRLDGTNAAGLSLQASIRERLAAPKAVAETPAPRPASSGEIEEQLRVALVEGRRLVNDGQYLAAIEVLENADRAIAMAPAGVNLAPYRAETATVLSAAREKAKVAAPKPTTPGVWNPDGTRHRDELGPVPAATVTEDDRHSITRENKARFWAKPTTYNEEFDFAVAELAVQPIGPPPLIRYPADWAQKTARRAPEANLWPKWYNNLKAKLAEPLASKVDFKGATLAQAVDVLKNLTGLPLVNAAAVKAGLDQAKVTFSVEKVSVEAALKLVADQTGTDYTLRDEIILFTTPERAKTLAVPHAYYIDDIVYPRMNNLEWRPLVPPQPWEANPWWDRYMDYWMRWGGGGWGGGNTGGYGGEGPYPPFWPNKYLETRQQRTELLFDQINRVIAGAEK